MLVLLTAVEVAAILRCSKYHVYDLGDREEIEVVRLSSNMVRYTRASVEAYINRKKR